MNALPIKLAMIEFRRAFSKLAPGGRDFLWLFLLLFLVQLLGLVLISAREGVLQKSVDAFLGNKPGYGTPVWTVPNFLESNASLEINNEAIAEFEKNGFHTEPFHTVVQYQFLRFAGRGAWRGINSSNQADVFQGLAVDLKGALNPENFSDVGQAALTGDANLWEIVLDRDVALRNLDVPAYKAGLVGHLPYSVIAEISDDPEEWSNIWFLLRVGGIDRITKFRLTWSKHLSLASTPAAFLLSLDLFNLVEVVKNNPKLCAFPEEGPNGGRRILQINSKIKALIPRDQRDKVETAFRDFAQVLGGKFNARGGRFSIYIGDEAQDREAQRTACFGGMSEYIFTLFATQSGFDSNIFVLSKTLESPMGYQFGNGQLRAPCDDLAARFLDISELEYIDGKCLANFRFGDRKSGYASVITFARDRTDIRPLIDFMECKPVAGKDAPKDRPALCKGGENLPDFVPAVRMHNVYQDALNRFGFLTELLKILSSPISIVLLGTLVSIQWVQIGTVLGHRKFSYAILLSNGLSWGQLRLMILTQIAMAVILSFGAAISVLVAIRVALNTQLVPLSLRFEKVTNGAPIDALPIQFSTSALSLLAVLLFSLIVALAHLRLLGVSSNQSIEKLLG